MEVDAVKKILAMILLLVLSLSAVSCGKDTPKEPEREPGKYTYAELDAMPAEELTRVFTENGMVIPDALTKDKTDEEIASMVKEFFPNIVSGIVVMDWTVPVNYVKDTHLIYEKIILRSSPVSGKHYVSEADGFGGKQTLDFSDDGSGQYYVGPLSSYIAVGEWTADGDTVTLTMSPTEWDGEDAKGFSLNFRLNGDGSLNYVSNGAEAGRFEKYLRDGDVFIEGNRMEFYPNTENTVTTATKKIEVGDDLRDFYGKDDVEITFNYALITTLKYESHYRVAICGWDGIVTDVIAFDLDGNIIENSGAEVFPNDIFDKTADGDTFDSLTKSLGTPTVDLGSGLYIPGYVTTDGKLRVIRQILYTDGTMSEDPIIIKYDLLVGDAATNSRYVYDGEGAGGDFTITLSESGRFQYYEGMLSSYIGMGHWTLEDGILTLTDDDGVGRIIDNEDGTTSFEETQGFVNRFKMEDGKLIFIAEGSDNFLYVKLEDGAEFKREMSSPVIP